MRLYNLQALRGIACLLVVFYHVADWEFLAGGAVSQPLLSPLRYFGFAGVDLFFVLSGFVITWVNSAALGDRTRLVGYLGRRIWRIYPVYWICWVAAVLLAHGWAITKYWLRNPRIVGTWRFLVLVPTSDPNLGLAQAWTLCFEVMFYVAFAAFFVLPRRAFLPLLGLWAAAAVAAMVVPAAAFLRSSYVTNWLLNPLVVEFLMGCVAATAVRHGWTGWGRTILIAGLVGFVGAGLTAYGASIETAARYEFRSFLFGVPSALIVYGTVAVERARGSVLPRWLQVVGDASYPIYLLHLAVIDWFRTALGGSNQNLPAHLLCISALSGAGLAAGFLIHFAVERPLLALGKRRHSVPAAPAAGPRRAA